MSVTFFLEISLVILILLSRIVLSKVFKTNVDSESHYSYDSGGPPSLLPPDPGPRPEGGTLCLLKT